MLIWDPDGKKSYLGSGMEKIRIRESGMEKIRIRMEKIRIRDGKISEGSGINIPDPQHW
jgi:hypothetical protein